MTVFLGESTETDREAVLLPSGKPISAEAKLSARLINIGSQRGWFLWGPT
jgi:hypothetical protein